ncbi:MAG: transporter substrate-binding domain-containing protein [Desulfobacterium sp.]|nr:transporter substrate-binding domain-containing protein [Desulfobacterium sp.]
MGYRIYCYTILILTMTTLGFGGEKTVRIATLKDYPPFCMAVGEFEINQTIPPGDDAVGFQGYSWDIIRQSFHKMGYTIHLSILPWTRAMTYIQKGQTDLLFPTGNNTDRQKLFYYSKESVNEVNFVVYVQTENPIKWKGLESLQGLTIGIKRGFNYGNEWKAARGIIKYNVNTIWQGFKMLDANRLDGFMGYEYNWDYVLKQNNLNQKYRKLPFLTGSLEYIVVLKSNPNSRAILNAYDTGKKELIRTGELKHIRNKWFEN